MGATEKIHRTPHYHLFLLSDLMLTEMVPLLLPHTPFHTVTTKFLLNVFIANILNTLHMLPHSSKTQPNKLNSYLIQAFTPLSEAVGTLYSIIFLHSLTSEYTIISYYTYGNQSYLLLTENTHTQNNGNAP